MKLSSRIITVFFVMLLCATGLADDGKFVVPSDLEDVETDVGNQFPFNSEPFWETINDIICDPADQVSSQRYQQVSADFEFAALPGPGLVTQVAFRQWVLGSPFAAVCPHVQINLSTSANGPGSISETFADNVGPDETVVVSAGALPLSSVAIGGTPRPFDIVVSFESPFIYDPVDGHLLLDVRMIELCTSQPFASMFDGLGSTSRSVTTFDFEGDCHDLSDPDGTVFPNGLVMEWTILTGEQQQEDLIEDVEDLFDDGTLNNGQANSLIAKLNASLKANNVNTAVNIMEAFINAVESFVSEGVLTPAQGADLINAANNIIMTLLAG
jgi:hypothetical protein